MAEHVEDSLLRGHAKTSRDLHPESALPQAGDIQTPIQHFAMCQSTKSLCDSGEVRLGLSIIPRGEIAGSGGSGLS
jgi:hypothetical protein